MTDATPRDKTLRGYLNPEWRERNQKEALSCDLLLELGYDPTKIVASSTSVRGVLDVEGDRCIRLEVIDLNARGGRHYIRRPNGEYAPASHIEFVDVEPERLAKYRADVEALG